MALVSEQKIVAIHQPNYMPWLGFFYKIYACDIFVFHDNVEHSKRYPTRRTQVRASSVDSKPVWLTVPLKRHSDNALVKDLEIDHQQDWPAKHLRKLKNSYHRAIFFDHFIGKLEGWYAEADKFHSLADLNIFFIQNLMCCLDIDRKTVRSSALPVTGRASDFNFGLVKYLGGNVYLSGSGGSNYQDEVLFNQAGIALDYSHFATYFKEKHPDMPFGYSILDALFHLGTNGIKNMLSLCPKK